MKSIVIICYSRPELLTNCIDSVLRARDNEKFSKIIIQQTGNIEVAKVVEKYRGQFDQVIQVDRSGSATENISRNRYLAYQVSFDQLQSDYSIVLEDDVEISEDALVFADEMHMKYRGNKNFRAVNLGSGVKFEESNMFTFSRVRYALHGPASMIPRSSWNLISAKGIERLVSKGIFDGVIECLIKTGFVIMPNVSRYKDFGYIGTHSDESNQSSYFSKLLESSSTGLPLADKEFSESFIDQNWRSDCVRYRPYAKLHYLIRALIIFNSDKQPFKTLWKTHFFVNRLFTRRINRIG